MMATLRAESWEIDFCLSPLMSAAREWNQQPSYNHTAPSPSALTVWMSCSREEKSRRIISSSHSASTLPDHMDPLLNWKQPLPLGLLLSCLGVRPPLLFPLWKWCSVWLLCGFIWWHRSHKKMVKRREGGASHWQWDGCHKWQPLVFVNYTEMLAEQTEAKGNNLFTCSVWLSKPWHCRNLLLFQVCFPVAGGV